VASPKKEKKHAMEQNDVPPSRFLAMPPICRNYDT